MPPPKKFTEEAIAKIAFLIDQGYTAEHIAEHVGCTLGSLRVRCSQFGISLRHRKTRKINLSRLDAPNAALRSDQHRRLKISLPHATADRLRRQAGLMRTSEATLAAALLEAIVQDDLYQAVLRDNLMPDLK